MKLAVLKLTSLLVLLVGLLPIALMFADVPYADQVGSVLRNLAPLAESEIGTTEKIVTIAVSVVLVIVGFYGFIPTFSRRKAGRQLVIKGKEGNITLNLDTLQVALARELTNMKEVHKAKLHIEPIKGGKKANVSAVVEIEKLSGVSTREIANTISAELTRNAKEVLGLEDMLKVKLEIDGIHVDEKAQSAAKSATAATPAEKKETVVAPQKAPPATEAARPSPEQEAITEEKVDAVSTSPASPAPIAAAESEDKDSPFDMDKEEASFAPDVATKSDSDIGSDFNWRDSSLGSEDSDETKKEEETQEFTTDFTFDSDKEEKDEENKDEEDKHRYW